MKTITLLTIWLITGMLAAGATNALFKIDSNGYSITYTNKQRARIECGQAFAFGLGGPIALAGIAFISGGFVYGFDWTCDNYTETRGSGKLDHPRMFVID